MGDRCEHKLGLKFTTAQAKNGATKGVANEVGNRAIYRASNGAKNGP